MVQSVFEIFKIVLGIIIAGFFLYFMLQFAGLYTTTETKSAEVQEYKNLKKLVEDTYIYNIPTSADLKKIPAFASPPYISEGAAVSVNPSILFFFNPGKRLAVYRGSLDLGFWKTDFVGVIPEQRIFYGLEEYEFDHLSFIQNLTELFPQSADPLIDFGFCSGDSELISKNRDDFLKPIKGIVKTRSSGSLDDLRNNLRPCTADFQQPKTKVIITKLRSIQAPENANNRKGRKRHLQK